MVEFNDQDSALFDEIMTVLKCYSNITHLKIKDETVLSLPGLEINFNLRKVYFNQKEVTLTIKEYEILCLLATNRGRVLTYNQIYQRVWGVDALGNEKKSIGFHINNLRKKLCGANSPLFTIDNVHGVGYQIK